MSARLLPRAVEAPAPEAAWADAPGPALFPADEDDGPAFELRTPAGGASTALVTASPHSGRLYPADMMALATLDHRAIRASEDAFVDCLVASAPAHGAPLLTARHARAYVDLNRAPYELDPAMFTGPAPRPCTRTARAAAGLGSVARVVGEGCEIYAAPLAFSAAQARLDRVHGPYHAALDRLMGEAQARFGAAVLIDWHSMPAAAVRGGHGPAPDMVLGDRHGASAADAVTRRVEREIARCGWKTARNRPYAGGHVAERHGRPAERRHVVQVEIRRDLYLDEATLKPHAGFAPLQAALGALIARLAAVDWPAVA